MNVTIGATLTGGATAVLAPAGIMPGKSIFTAPTHSRLEPRTVEFTSAAPTASAKDPGVARSGMKITLADRQVEEGCCTVATGLVAIDLGFRWHLNQPVELVDDAIALLQGLVFNTAFIAALKDGSLPSA